MKLGKIHILSVPEGLKKLKSNFVDLIVADPPFNKGKNYGEGYNDNKSIKEYYSFCNEWIKEGFRILKPSGTFWIYINSRHLGRLQIIGEKYGVWQNTIIWHYTNPTPDTKRFPKTWGAWLMFSKTDAFYFNPLSEAVKSHSRHGSAVGKTRINDIWNDISKLTGGYLAQPEVILKSGTKERIFIFQLPEKMINRILKFCSKKDDLILDIFSHSAVTSAMCIRLNRNFIAMEQSEYFAKIAEKRLNREKKRKQKGIFF